MRKKKPDLGAILKKSKKILLIFLKNKYIRVNKIKYQMCTCMMHKNIYKHTQHSRKYTHVNNF